MKVIVIGSGRFGSALAVRLSQEKHHVVVLDVSSGSFERYLPADFGGRTVLGDGIDEDVLREAGIETADAVAAAMHGDNHNLMVAQIAKVRFHVPRVVARCNDPVRAELYQGLGLAIICPSQIGAAAMYDAVMSDARQQKDVAGAIDKMLVK
jgi:trk system potassium uptake protein